MYAIIGRQYILLQYQSLRARFVCLEAMLLTKMKLLVGIFPFLA